MRITIPAAASRRSQRRGSSNSVDAEEEEEEEKEKEPSLGTQHPRIKISGLKSSSDDSYSNGPRKEAGETRRISLRIPKTASAASGKTAASGHSSSSSDAASAAEPHEDLRSRSTRSSLKRPPAEATTDESRPKKDRKSAPVLDVERQQSAKKQQSNGKVKKEDDSKDFKKKNSPSPEKQAPKGSTASSDLGKITTAPVKSEPHPPTVITPASLQMQQYHRIHHDLAMKAPLPQLEDSRVPFTASDQCISQNDSAAPNFVYVRPSKVYCCKHCGQPKKGHTCTNPPGTSSYRDRTFPPIQNRSNARSPSIDLSMMGGDATTPFAFSLPQPQDFVMEYNGIPPYPHHFNNPYNPYAHYAHHMFQGAMANPWEALSSAVGDQTMPHVPVPQQHQQQLHQRDPAMEERVVAALEERMYVLSRSGDFVSQSFVVLDGDAAKSKVSFGATTSCECSEVAADGLCKHLLFVKLRVLGFPRDSELISWPTYPQHLVTDILRRAPRREPGLGPPTSDRDTCPVCWETMVTDEGWTSCDYCGEAWHGMCAGVWLRERGDASGGGCCAASAADTPSSTVS